MIKFLTSNKFDTATLTSLSAATGYPASNLQSRFLKQTWRSTGLANEWLKFDMGSAKSLAAFTGFYNNLTSGATIKLYGHASDMGNLESDWAAATYSTTITNFDDRTIYLSLAQTFRWWLFTFSDAGNTNGYVELGRVYGGDVTSPTLNFNENFTDTFIDPSEQNWTIGDHVYSTQRERYKNFAVNFLDMNSTDKNTLYTLYKTFYKTEPFVLILDDSSEPVNLTRYVMCTSDFENSGTANNRFNIPMSFRELR